MHFLLGWRNTMKTALVSNSDGQVLWLLFKETRCLEPLMAGLAKNKHGYLHCQFLVSRKELPLSDLDHSCFSIQTPHNRYFMVYQDLYIFCLNYNDYSK